jgi:hypothetical protein
MIICMGVLTHKQWMFAGNAYAGLSKDTEWSVADADPVITFGVYHVSM